MQPTLRLIDPAGQTRAVLDSSATPEELLRSALGLGPSDSLLVCVVGDAEWSLAVLRAGTDGKLMVVGPKVPEVSRDRWDNMRKAMAETAWLDLVDDGWVVLTTEGQSQARSIP